MSQNAKTPAHGKNQGEGDREAARRYNQDQREFVQSGQVDAAAEQATGDAEAVGAQWGRPTSRYALHRRRDGHQPWRRERNAGSSLQHGYDTVPIDGRTAARIREGSLDGPRG